MRGVNFYLTLILGALLVGPAFAADEAEETVRVDLQNEFTSKPFTAKKLYREAWENDNLPKMNYIDQIEYMQKHGTGLDSDTKIIMDAGVQLMKKMNFGQKGKDITENAAAIQENPAAAVQTLSEGAEIDIDTNELLAIVAKTIEPSQRLMEKVYKDKTLGKVTYPLDVDSF